MLQLILFDIDGTLISSGGAGRRAFDVAMSSLFEVPDATASISFAGRTDTGLIREIFERHGVEASDENVSLFFDTYAFLLDHYLESSDTGTCPGIWKFIGAVQALENPPALGLLTGNIRLGAEIKLRHFRLWDFFEFGAFGCDHHNRNELAVLARNRFQKLCGRKVSGNEILVVGDTPLDIEAARAIGAHSLAVATGEHSINKLKTHQPTLAVEHLGKSPALDLLDRMGLIPAPEPEYRGAS